MPDKYANARSFRMRDTRNQEIKTPDEEADDQKQALSKSSEESFQQYCQQSVSANYNGINGLYDKQDLIFPDFYKILFEN